MNCSVFVWKFRKLEQSVENFNTLHNFLDTVIYVYYLDKIDTISCLDKCRSVLSLDTYIHVILRLFACNYKSQGRLFNSFLTTRYRLSTGKDADIACKGNGHQAKINAWPLLMLTQRYYILPWIFWIIPITIFQYIKIEFFRMNVIRSDLEILILKNITLIKRCENINNLLKTCTYYWSAVLILINFFLDLIIRENVYILVLFCSQKNTRTK